VRHHAAGGPTPERQLWTIGTLLARLLAAVHARGIVHCDVKPANLLIRGHVTRVIDFGIARYAGERCGDDGIVRCSRRWAAPEQLYAASATPAVDVFAWGCLIAYLASGVHPFASRNEQEWILRVQSVEPDLLGFAKGTGRCGPRDVGARAAAPAQRGRTGHDLPGAPRHEPPLAARISSFTGGPHASGHAWILVNTPGSFRRSDSMGGFQLRRLGQIMGPEPDRPLEAEGVLNPAAGRGSRPRW